MSSYRQNLHHLVFRTKNNERTIPAFKSEELYKYIWGIIKGNNCFLYRIGGVEDHIHILSDLHPDITLSNYMKQIKACSSLWMKKSGNYPDFNGWALGYGSFTVSYKEKDMIINYIKNQVEHHKTVSFMDEYRSLLKENGISFDEKYFP